MNKNTFLKTIAAACSETSTREEILDNASHIINARIDSNLSRMVADCVNSAYAENNEAGAVNDIKNDLEWAIAELRRIHQAVVTVWSDN